MTRSMIAHELIRLHLQQSEASIHDAGEIVRAEQGHGFGCEDSLHLEQLAQQVAAYRQLVEDGIIEAGMKPNGI